MSQPITFTCETCRNVFSVSQWRLNFYQKRGTVRPRFCSHTCKGNTLSDLLSKCDCSGGSDACWIWGGYVFDRYGTTPIGGNPIAVHRAIWIFRNGPIPDGIFVCHRCDEPLCCNPRHHFLGSADDNNKDKMAKGRQPHGEQVASAILTTQQVAEIRALLVRPERGLGRRLSERYGVSPSTISAIKVGRIWSSRSQTNARGM